MRSGNFWVSLVFGNCGRKGLFFYYFSFLGFFFLAILRDVLWCCSLGPVADYCPDCLLTMFVLPHVGSFLIGVGRDPGFSDEPGVLLRLRDGHRVHSNRVVCDCFVRAQRRRRVRKSDFVGRIDFCFRWFCIVLRSSGVWRVVKSLGLM